MTGRLVDDIEFLQEAKNFSKREHGTALWRFVFAFATAFFLILVSLSFTNIEEFWSVTLVVFIILGSLLAVICSFAIKDKRTINATELQNALLAGAAKIATEFCVIVRNDGKIIYVDPEYRKKILKGHESNVTLNTLCKSGIITKMDKAKLMSAMADGKKESINFNLPDSPQDSSTLAFLLEPVGIYKRSENTKRIRLAVKPIARPSGYFLLKAPKEEKDSSEDKKDAFLKKFGIGTYRIKSNGQIKHVNESLESDLGYNNDEICSLGLSLKDLFYDESELKQLMKTREDWHAIVPLRNKDNMIVSALIEHKVTKSKNGQISGGYGVLIPFSQIANENEDGDNQYDLVNNSPIPTAILSKDGVIKRHNREFGSMADLKQGKSENLKLLDIVTSEEKGQIRDLLKDVASGKISGTSPIDVKVKSDGGATASLYVSRIMDDYGAVSGLIVHLIDTTELKNLELRFVHSQKMQAVGQLAGGIAHDFNNLLTAMMGFCDLLLIKHPAGDSSFADIMQIKQNANRAANLVRQLLAFSRKQTLQPKVINITDVLADLSNLIGRLIGENIELQMEHGRDLGNVKVDQGQLEQVIINLAVNARDAMGEGGLLTIKTSNFKVTDKTKLNKNLIPPAEDEVIENGEYVLVEVIDTGCGMKKEQIGQIFEPFYSTKEIGEGTGLGLSTVYGIIKQTDGYVYVSSKPGKGTNFSIFLKRYHDGESYKEVKKESLEKSVAKDLAGSGTILLVEDETPVRIFSNSALTGKGYKVLEADCGEAALEVMKEKGSEIDIIITDVVMPGMSGPDMIKQVSDKHPDIKVIFISGYGEDAFIETFGEERKFNFLSKPYSLKQLATKVKEVLEGE